MSSNNRHKERDKYRSRINSLLITYRENGDAIIDIESLSHNAKYVAVLVSGYMEQAIKEIVFEYISSRAEGSVGSYLQNTWPNSRNMNTSNIRSILGKFDSKWEKDFDSWLLEQAERKTDINSIVSWRNNIAHGHERKTTGVTLVSVKEKFSTVQSLVVFLESTFLDG